MQLFHNSPRPREQIFSIKPQPLSRALKFEYINRITAQLPITTFGEMAERSKALASGASREICVGSNPTLITINLFAILRPKVVVVFKFLRLGMKVVCAGEPRESGADKLEIYLGVVPPLRTRYT